MRWMIIFVLITVLGLAPAVFAADPVTGPPSDALKNVTILIIRHAEKPASGKQLAPAGYARAQAYVGFFRNFKVDGRPLPLDHLFCTADSKGSQRPRLTVTPLSQALNLPLDNRFSNQEAEALAAEIRAQPHGRGILICWHHGEIPDLLTGLGADPERLLPGGEWPGEVFGWMIELRYDDAGRLAKARLINENLMPDDKTAPAIHE